MTQTFIAHLLRPVVASGLSGCLLLTKWLGMLSGLLAELGLLRDLRAGLG